ncbi:MAG: PIN domain-containing protein [Phycisphaerae bacterium]|nr:PIN domain-containing protein [Phycisphaerae bacterium]
MSSLVVDTHAILWYLGDSKRLSQAAASRMSASLKGGYPLYVPSICLVELTYLVEKGRLVPEARSFLCDRLLDPGSGLLLARLDYGVAEAVERIPRDQVPEMPDRIIAATALYLQVPLVSCDLSIRNAPISVVW